MKLLTPGPVELHPRILKSLSNNIIYHRGENARRLIKSIVEDLKTLHGTTEGLIAIGPGSGTTSVDSMTWSLIGKRDRVLVISHGEFGRRLATTISKTGAEVEVISEEPGRPVDPSLIIDKSRGFNIIGIVYNETSTGMIYSDLEQLAKRLCGHVDMFIVDAVSAIGAAELYMDKWCIDAIASAPHKAVGAPPGAFIVALNRGLVKRRRHSVPPSIDAVLHATLIEERGETPFTPPLNTLYGLREALDMVKEEGVDGWIKLHRSRVEILYDSMTSILKPLVEKPEYRSNNIAAFTTQIEASKIVGYLESRGYRIATGMGELKSTVIRIGVMGYIGIDDIKTVALLIKEALTTH